MWKTASPELTVEVGLHRGNNLHILLDSSTELQKVFRGLLFHGSTTSRKPSKAFS